MAAPKAQTLQQRFGFMDDDLKTSGHDEIMLWLDKNAADVIRQLFYKPEWDKRSIEGKKEEMTQAINRALATYEKEAANSRDNIKRWQNSIEDSPNDKWYREYFEKEQAKLEKILDFWASLEDWSDFPEVPDKPDIEIESIEWEVVVKRENYKSEYIIGFIDMDVTYHVPGLVTNLKYNNSGDLHLPEYQFPKWEIEFSSRVVHFEVKTSIPSLGELIRQINMYREYKGGAFVVVSPDDRFIEPLKNQDIYFYKYSGNGKR